MPSARYCIYVGRSFRKQRLVACRAAAGTDAGKLLRAVSAASRKDRAAATIVFVPDDGTRPSVMARCDRKGRCKVT